MLIILAGLPGSGKSTLARHLAGHLSAVYVRIDSIEQALARSTLRIRAAEDAGYAVGYAVAADNLRLGRTVVADSVNPIDLTRDAWRAVAADAGCAAVEVEVVCSDAAEHRRRVETRTADIAGHRLPTWQDVEAREYHAWTRDRIVVDTAGRPVGDCVAEVVAALPSQEEQAE